MTAHIPMDNSAFFDEKSRNDAIERAKALALIYPEKVFSIAELVGFVVNRRLAENKNSISYAKQPEIEKTVEAVLACGYTPMMYANASNNSDLDDYYKAPPEFELASTEPEESPEKEAEAEPDPNAGKSYGQIAYEACNEVLKKQLDNNDTSDTSIRLYTWETAGPVVKESFDNASQAVMAEYMKVIEQEFAQFLRDCQGDLSS